MINLDIDIFSYLLKEKQLLLSAKDSITEEYISDTYRPFYKLLIKCFDKFREVPTIRVMEEQGNGGWDEGFKEIYKLAENNIVDDREFPSIIEKLKERYNTQVLLKLGLEVFQKNLSGQEFKNLEEVNKILKRTTSTISSIYSSKIFKEGALSATAEDTWKEYKRVKDNPNLARGIHLGFREFDKITNGLQQAELLLIGGEPGSGKSALVMNMAVNAWLGENKNLIPKSLTEFPEVIIFDGSGSNVLYFTLEMPFKAQRRRLDACIASLPLYGLRDATLTTEEEDRYKASLKFQKMYDKQFHIVDIPRGCTMTQIESKYIEKCYEFKPDLVVIDYISLMSSGEESGQDWLNLGKISEQLHEFCRAYNIPVISPVQLTRPKSNGKKDEANIADQSRIGRSFMFVQNANIILNIEKRADEDTRKDMLIRVAKMRDGETPVFALYKRLEYMQIYGDIPEWTLEEFEEDGKSIG